VSDIEAVLRETLRLRPEETKELAAALEKCGMEEEGEGGREGGRDGGRISFVSFW